MESVVLRFPPFMEVWLALVGSSAPARGESHATVDRPSPFLRRFRTMTGSLVERRGLMLVSGAPTARLDPATMTTVREFLEEKAALPG